MSTAARRPVRPPRLFVVPEAGHRVCLFDAIFDDAHDHGTVVALRDDGRGVKALIEWDDDPERGEAGWCDLDAVRLNCATRDLNTRGNHPRTDER